MNSPINETGFQVGALLLAAPDVSARASLIASAVVELVPDTACAVLWLTVAEDEASWTVIGLAGEVSAEQTELGAGNRLIAPPSLNQPRLSSIPVRRWSAKILRISTLHAPSRQLPIFPFSMKTS